MMSWFFRRKPKYRPTEKQRAYAKKLGIEIAPKMSKADVSRLISEAERSNPKLHRQREHIKENAHLKKHGKELVDAEDHWNEFAESTEYMLAVYKRGKKVVVDVLRVNGALINGRGKLALETEAPKRRKDRHLGEYLEWDRCQEIPVAKLLHYEPLHREFHDEPLGVYKRTVQKGLKIAKKL